MRRATFSVLFYANKSKVKDGIVPVMGRITINGTQSQFSCKRSIPLTLWDAKGNCAKGRTREALDLNHDLDNIKAQIIKHYQHLSDREAFVTAEMVRNSYQGFGSEYETLLRAFDKDCESLKRRVGKDRALGTYKLQVRSRNYVADFLQMNFRRTDISMQVIDFSRFARRRTHARLHQGVCRVPCQRPSLSQVHHLADVYASERSRWPRP